MRQSGPQDKMHYKRQERHNTMIEDNSSFIRTVYAGRNLLTEFVLMKQSRKENRQIYVHS